MHLAQFIAQAHRIALAAWPTASVHCSVGHWHHPSISGASDLQFEICVVSSGPLVLARVSAPTVADALGRLLAATPQEEPTSGVPALSLDVASVEVAS